MATNARTVVNRKALTLLQGSFADALADMGRDVIAITRPPDATPFGAGLVTSGDWGVWNGTRKVDGGAAKPRAARLRQGALHMLVGYGFPGRFQEIGTIHQPARPFLTPSWLQITGAADSYFRAAFHRIAGQLRGG